MMTKTLVERVTKGCSHSVPVLIPCGECVEKALTGWQIRVREDYKREMTEEVKLALQTSEKSKSEVEAFQARQEKMQKNIDTLTNANIILREQNKKLRSEIEDMQARLLAEHAVKHFPKYNMSANE